MTIAIVLGTRPEIVKLAGIVRLLGDRALVIATGQHWDDALAGDFLTDLEVGEPALWLEIGGLRRGEQVGRATDQLTALFAEERPDAVVVQGDTNSALAGALAANAEEVPLVHVEAGLRSHDRAMPEEHNRVVVDHLADLLLAPTDTAAGNLRSEGIPDERIVVTGNTVVEAVRGLAPADVTGLLERWGVEAGRFVLATFHRPENVDGERLAAVLDALARLPMPVVLPLHPRTRARAVAAGLALGGVVTCDPLPYRQFIGLFRQSALVISDSGGVQEEASVLKRPVLVVRRSTERPEVLGTFARLVPDPAMVPDEAATFLDDPAEWRRRLARLPCPYGDGSASERSVAALDVLLAV